MLIHIIIKAQVNVIKHLNKISVSCEQKGCEFIMYGFDDYNPPSQESKECNHKWVFQETYKDYKEIGSKIFSITFIRVDRYYCTNCCEINEITKQEDVDLPCDGRRNILEFAPVWYQNIKGGINIDDYLEPLKVESALRSEEMKMKYRKENKPEDVSILDYTIIKALEKQMSIKVEMRVVDEQEASGFSETCPTCHVFVYDNYCQNCGQNLDWEQKGEKL